MATLDTFPGLSAALDDVKSFLAKEEEDSSETDSDLEDSIPAPRGVLRIVPAESGDQKGKNEPEAEEIKFTDLDEAQRAEWLRSREFLGQQMNLSLIHI